MFYEIYQKDIHKVADLKKAPKLTYTATFQKIINKASHLHWLCFMKPPRLLLKVITQADLMRQNFLSVFHKIFVICNSKNHFNTSNGLGDDYVGLPFKY